MGSIPTSTGIKIAFVTSQGATVGDWEPKPGAVFEYVRASTTIRAKAPQSQCSCHRDTIYPGFGLKDCEVAKGFLRGDEIGGSCPPFSVFHKIVP